MQGERGRTRLMKGPYDGDKRTYVFGRKVADHRPFTVAATTLAKAVRAFRVGALHPHQYSTGRIKTDYGSSHRDIAYMSSEPGSKVIVEVVTKSRPDGYSRRLATEWEEVTQIDPESADVEKEFGKALLAASQHLQIAAAAAGMGEGATTALAPAGDSTGISSMGRREVDQKVFELEKRMAALETAKHQMQMEVSKLRSELERRMEQIWMIELFLGSHEEVKMIRDGEPAPASTPITIRQQILCMDEELAIFDWFDNPDRIGQFDYKHLDDFDQWLIDDPRHLEAIFPQPKGIVGLRVRRNKKDRGTPSNIGDAWAMMEEEKMDEMTYLLVRNGDALYRLWVDVNMWPRLFSAEKDFEKTVRSYDWENKQHRSEKRALTDDEMQKVQKKFFAGMLVVQGLLERSDLFHPLPRPDLSVVKPEHQDHFELIRDGEDRILLADPDNEFGNLTWPNYNKWLKAQLGPGIRVQYSGPTYFSHGGNSDRDTWEQRTGIKSVSAAPERGEIYTLVEPVDGWRVPYRGKFQFKYLPDDTIWVKGDRWSHGHSKKRERMVRFGCFSDEIMAVDMISWRILEYLLKDRNSRAYYGEFFVQAFHWWQKKKAETEREKPFVDLVLTQAKVSLDNETERARCERLVRWWKMKTQEHRTLGDDEAKALRMISKAFKRGDDHDNDPETLLFKEDRK